VFYEYSHKELFDFLFDVKFKVTNHSAGAKAKSREGAQNKIRQRPGNAHQMP
jgi:hypothetical protein